MSTVVGLAWALATLAGVTVAYAALCVGVLLFVRVPVEPRYALLEDVIFVAVAPFVAVVLGLSLVSSDR